MHNAELLTFPYIDTRLVWVRSICQVFKDRVQVYRIFHQRNAMFLSNFSQFIAFR